MIGIVLLNYNTCSDAFNCIKSIETCNVRIPYKLYLIDNASPRKCDDLLLQGIKDKKNIVFFESKINKGYAAGNNIGIKMALDDGCDAVIICNTDVLFMNGTIEALYNRMKEDSHIGIIGPKILYHDRPQQITRYCKTEFKQKFFATTPLRHLWPSVEKEYYGLDLDENEERYAHDVSGCCFMVSKECAEQTMPMDEHTFLFEEELIMGERCKNAGFKVLYYPKCSVIHNHSGSTSTAAAFSYTKGTLSEIYYCRQYLQANFFQIFPLYMIRVLSYLSRMVSSSDYRKKFMSYLSSTFKGFWIPINQFNS